MVNDEVTVYVVSHYEKMFLAYRAGALPIITNIPSGALAVESLSNHLELWTSFRTRPPDTPDDQWNEQLQLPGQVSWPRFIFAYYPLYNASTAATLACLLAQYAPTRWPRNHLDLAIFVVPMIALPVLLNACAHAPWCSPSPPAFGGPMLAVNKIWLSILTVLSVTYCMTYALGRNYLDRRKWARCEKQAMASLRKRLSLLNNASDNATAAAASGALAANPVLLAEPLTTTEMFWMFSGTCQLASLYFFGQAASYAYFKTAPHSVWTDLGKAGVRTGPKSWRGPLTFSSVFLPLYVAVLINGFRIAHIIAGKLMLMLIASKIKSPHTLYAGEFFADMLYWIMYRNMFSASHSSPWTIPIFSLMHGLQRVLWIRVKFSESYHRLVTLLPEYLAAWGMSRWTDVVLLPQHQPSGASSTATFVDPFADDTGGLSSAAVAASHDVEEQRSGTTTVSPPRAAGGILRTAVVAGFDSETPTKNPYLKRASSAATSLANLSATTPTKYTYAAYLVAQSIYESHELLAQLLTISAFTLSILILPQTGNAPAYPTLTFDPTRKKILLTETLATMCAEILAAAVGHAWVWSVTGKHVLKEFARFASARPRTMLLVFATAVHVLYDSSLMLIFLRFND
ncbi:hypothetical protein HDU89_005272 [Geranomyces variabilis]|nr:hypothetical protein HDU89_005272 [Geranomyces variabilis]